MKTLADLANVIDTIQQELPQRVNDCKKEIATVVVTDLAKVTPADTGAAISNWRASVGTPLEDTTAPHVPSQRGKWRKGQWIHTVDPEITRAANAPVTIEAARLTIETAQPGVPVCITNNLPYIKVLNDGSSEQAPVGFVDRAIILGRTIMDKFKLLG